jgi:hypothetical protein
MADKSTMVEAHFSPAGVVPAESPAPIDQVPDDGGSEATLVPVPSGPISAGGKKLTLIRDPLIGARRIEIDRLRVVGKGRACSAENVDALAESMRTNGIKTAPIRVRATSDGMVLVAGRLAFDAARAAGQTHIDAIVVDGDETAAHLAEIAEILCHAAITALERAELVAEYVRLSTQLGEGGQLDHPPAGGQQPHDRGISKAARELPVPGHTEEARRKFVERALKIDGISAEAKSEAKQTWSDVTQRDLLAIASQATPKAQVAALRKCQKRKHVPRPKRSAPTAGVDGIEPTAQAESGLVARDEDEAARTPGASDPGHPTDAATVPVTKSGGVTQDGESPQRPAVLDQRDTTKVAANNIAAFAALTAAWRQHSEELQAAWATAPVAARERFIKEVLRRVPTKA